jgi:hypothetical protein
LVESAFLRAGIIICPLFKEILLIIFMNVKVQRKANMVVPFWYNAIIRQDEYAA